MRYRVRHATEYSYADPVSQSHHLAHLVPRTDNGQIVAARELRILPHPAFRRERIDVYGNRATYFSIEEPHRHLAVESRLEVEVPRAPPPPARSAAWDEVAARVARDRRADTLNAFAFAFASPCVRLSPGLREYAAPSFPAARPLLEAVMDLTRRVHADFVYDTRATNVSTPVDDVLAARRGVCQDFAHLTLGCLRALELPARYVSGYLRTRPPPGKPRLVGADASHAWVSVYLPDYGWMDFDPTNGVAAADEHITVACGRDFGDVAPLRGVILGGGTHELSVAVDVEVL